MTKNCTLNSKYDEVLHIMKNQYYQQYNYLSTSVDVKLLGNLWQSFVTKNLGHEDELSCFVALKMLQHDDFAFSIFKELHPDFITIQQALNDNVMDAYLDRAGLTDGSLAYLNAVDYLGNITSIGGEH
jgi:hypothetical protein